MEPYRDLNGAQPPVAGGVCLLFSMMIGMIARSEPAVVWISGRWEAFIGHKRKDQISDSGCLVKTSRRLCLWLSSEPMYDSLPIRNTSLRPLPGGCSSTMRCPSALPLHSHRSSFTPTPLPTVLHGAQPPLISSLTSHRTISTLARTQHHLVGPNNVVSITLRTPTPPPRCSTLQRDRPLR